MILAADEIDVRLQNRPVLERVTVALEPGRITAIVGPNGAGKSTLLKALAGLIEPVNGRVTLDGQPLARFNRPALARSIAYLPQERLVHWPLTARAIVALGRLPHRTAYAGESGRDAAAIGTAMVAMDIGAFADRPVNELSGGERARVLFARALAQEAAVILADEPTAGLDPAHTLELFASLVRLAAQGRSIAVVLHDLALAVRFCHAALILRDGRIMAAGPASEVLLPGQLSRAFDVEMAVGSVAGVPVIIPVAPRQS